MTTQPPDPGDEQPQAGDVTPPDPTQPAPLPPLPPPMGDVPSADPTQPAAPPPMPPPMGDVPPPDPGQHAAPPPLPPPDPGQLAPMPPAEFPPPGAEFPPMAPPPAGYGYPQPGYADVPAGMYYDAESGLTLPQGTQLASVGRRIGAFFLSIGLFIITLGIGWVIWGLIVWANGQTPALQVLGMRCWRPETGRVAGWWWMALREIAGRIVESILGFITDIVSLILMLVTKERKSLHDFIAGTVVLHDPDKVLPSWPPVP
jgi:uncharacterized RDD family membrane protein YckC